MLSTPLVFISVFSTFTVQVHGAELLLEAQKRVVAFLL